MEGKLEKLLPATLESKDLRKETPLETTEYKGIMLLEERAYSGGTSIRYWM
jgi:hypothetical protein